MRLDLATTTHPRLLGLVTTPNPRRLGLVTTPHPRHLTPHSRCPGLATAPGFGDNDTPVCLGLARR